MDSIGIRSGSGCPHGRGTKRSSDAASLRGHLLEPDGGEDQTCEGPDAETATGSRCRRQHWTMAKQTWAETNPWMTSLVNADLAGASKRDWLDVQTDEFRWDRGRSPPLGRDGQPAGASPNVRVGLPGPASPATSEPSHRRCGASPNSGGISRTHHRRQAAVPPAQMRHGSRPRWRAEPRDICSIRDRPPPRSSDIARGTIMALQSSRRWYVEPSLVANTKSCARRDSNPWTQNRRSRSQSSQ